MTIASTNTVVDQTSDAAFRTWVAEIITMLFTTVGATQTADTGQINTSTVTRAAVINTAAGYVIGRFNDTAQSTSPVFFKLEFGTGTAQPANPAMWITVGTGSNGSGTITGTVSTRVALGNFAAILSTTTPFITRACYSAAAGVLWLSWKLGAVSGGATTTALGGFAIFRSADNTGTVTTDSVHILSASATAAGTSATGALQSISYLSSVAYNTTAPYSSAAWGFMPFTLTTTLFSSNAQAGPVFQYTPVVGITPWVGIVLNTEFGINSTNVMALVGSTTHTYVNVGGFGGMASFTNANAGTGYTSANYGLILLYE